MLVHNASTLSAGANMSLGPTAAIQLSPPYGEFMTYHFPETKPCLMDISLSFSVASRWTCEMMCMSGGYRRCGRHITSSRSSFLLLRPFFLLARMGMDSSFYCIRMLDSSYSISACSAYLYVFHAFGHLLHYVIICEIHRRKSPIVLTQLYRLFGRSIYVGVFLCRCGSFYP